MKTSYKIALSATLLLLLWLVLGSQINSPQANESISKPETTQEILPLVQVKDSQAKPVAPELRLNGRVEPERVLTLRAETAGQVAQLNRREGERLDQGEVLLQLAIADRSAQRLRAESQLTQAQRRFEAKSSLHQQGFTSSASLDEAQALLKLREADLLSIQLDIERTMIKAPFGGIIEQIAVETGSYVNVGDQVATVVDNQPLRVVVHVPQHQIAELKQGQSATVNLLGQPPQQGRIRFISPRAADRDRSFRVEIEVPNPRQLPSGTSATVQIDRQPVSTHFVSPASILLNDKGETGVHLVNAQDRVEFHRINIIKSLSNGLHVDGLPQQAMIISTGAQLVSAGQQVRYQRENNTP